MIAGERGSGSCSVDVDRQRGRAGLITALLPASERHDALGQSGPGSLEEASTAIDELVAAGDVGGFVRGQKHHQAGHFRRLGEPLQRNVGE